MRAMDKNLITSRSYQCQDPSYPIVIKPKSNQDFPDIVPIQFIVSFGYVQLHDNSSFYLISKRLHHFMSFDDVIKNFLPSTYPDYSPATSEGKRGLSLFAATFDIIL